MSFSTRHSWIAGENEGSFITRRKVALMVMYWVVVLFSSNFVLNIVLQKFYKIYITNGIFSKFVTLKGIKLCIKGYLRFGLSGAIYNVLYALSAVWFVAACIFAYVFYRRDRGDSIDYTHGSAHWATEEEIRRAGLISKAEGGIICGGWINPKGESFFLTHSGPEHVLVVAPTRAGKGVSNIRPTLLTWKESALILDIKGENWDTTAGYRSRELGQYCLRFEPTDPGDIETIKKDIDIHIRHDMKAKGEPIDDAVVEKMVNEFYTAHEKHLGPARFNPLLEVHLGTVYETAEIQQIATMLVDPDGKGLEDYWAQAGFELMTGAITYECYIARNSGREPTLAGVRKQITSGDIQVTLEDWEAAELLTDAEAEYYAKIMPEREPGDHTHPLVSTVAKSMSQKQEKELSGVFSTANANLSLFIDPVVAKNTSDATFTVSSIVNSDRPVSVYLVVPPSDLARLRPLIRLFIVQVVNGLTQKMKKDDDGVARAGYLHKLLLMLDEFPQLRKLDQLQMAMAQMTGYGLKAYIITQSYTQLTDVYGKDETISSNCQVHIAFAPNDEGSAQKLSELCGKTTEIVGNISESGEKFAHGIFGKKNQTTSYSAHERPLLYPDEARRLPTAVKDENGLIQKPGKILVIAAGCAPIMGTQSLVFKNKEWTRRGNLDVPNINVNIKQRLNTIRILIDRWQRETANRGDKFETCLKKIHKLDVKDERWGILKTLDDAVIKKWFNPVLVRNPDAETEVLQLARNEAIKAEKKALTGKNKKFDELLTEIKKEEPISKADVNDTEKQSGDPDSDD